MKKINIFALTVLSVLAPSVYATNPGGSVDPGFTIPNLSGVISFMIKFLFLFAALAALLYLMLGAFAWVTSSGDKENVKKAQDKIQAAVIGLVVLVAVLVLLVTLEQVILKGTFCVGLTCDLQNTLPKLIQ